MYLNLFVCVCLVLGHTQPSSSKSIVTTENPMETTTSIPSNEHNEVLNVQKRLLKIQDDIISITAAMGIADSMDNLTHMIDDTVKEFKLVTAELASDDLKQQISECNKDAQTMLTNLFDAVATQIKYLESSFKACKEKRLPSDAAADIKALRFADAEKKVKALGDRKQLVTIFREVNNNCTRNFEVLVKFIESLSSNDHNDARTIIASAVTVVTDEMIRNHHRDPYQWMRLAKKLQTAVLNNPKVEYFEKKFAGFRSDQLTDLVKSFTLEALNASVSKGKFERDGEMDNLTTANFLFDPEHSKQIIKEFVNTNYGVRSSKKILEIIKSHKFMQQKVEGVSALFWNIHKSQNLNSDITLKIASTLYDIRSNSEEYGEVLNKTQRDDVDKIIDNLPVCARNLFFLPSVCLWNREKEEYLTAGTLSTKHDTERRNIFSTDPLPDSHWYVNTTTTGDNFMFSSRSYPKEFLYAAAFTFNKDLRYVFNWLPGGNTDIQSEWSIELNDDYCFIKSVAYNEYLFASNQLRDDLRKVFTWVPGYSVYKENRFQWQIRKCD